jgi:hypothetical protein
MPLSEQEASNLLDLLYSRAGEVAALYALMSLRLGKSVEEIKRWVQAKAECN